MSNVGSCSTFIPLVRTQLLRTDLIAVVQGSNMTAPLPVIIMGLVSLSLLYYGSKKGTV